MLPQISFAHKKLNEFVISFTLFMIVYGDQIKSFNELKYFETMHTVISEVWLGLPGEHSEKIERGWFSVINLLI